MNITLENIDLTNIGHLAHAVASLNTYAALSSSLLASTRDIRIDFRTLDHFAVVTSPSPAITDEEALAPSVPQDANLGIYGKTTKLFLQQMLTRIDQQGSATFEDVATDMGIGLDTARAYLRNAGRTASAHKVSLPVEPKWDHEKGRNNYVRS